MRLIGHFSRVTVTHPKIVQVLDWSKVEKKEQSDNQ